MASSGLAGEDPDAIFNVARQAISSATSMDALIATISSRYKGIVAPVLRSALDVCGKLNTARKTLAGYQQNKDSGTWPSFISGMHNPFTAIQPSKEARSALSDSLSEANTWFRLQKEEALAKVIHLKELEVEHLDKLCSLASIEAQIVKVLDADWETILVSLEKYTEKGKKPEDTGEIGKHIPSFFKQDLALAKRLANLWATQVWDFTRIKSQKTISLLERKKDLAAQADVPMADAPTMESMVQKAVQDAMKDLNLQGKKQNRGQVCLLNTLNPHNHVTNSSLGKRKQARDEEVRTTACPKRARTEEGHQTVSECWHHYEKASPGCKWCKRWAEKEAGKEELVRSCKWNLSRPTSFPKQILDLPTDLAVSIIQSRIPLTQVADADLKVKLGPGVFSIPEKIDSLLSMGHRFLFPSVFSISLPLESYMSLARRVKWIVHFGYSKKQTSFLDENPQFRIPTESTAVPDRNPIWVLALLEKGRLEMVKQITAIPSKVVQAPVDNVFRSELAQLRNWRKANNLLVLQSDKNLGTTIVSSEWYAKKLDDLVSNNTDFLPISEVVYLDMIKQARTEIEHSDFSGLLPEIKDFILADMTLDKARNNVPKFHGLPKVHKQPWALRPIVPCHSYPMANASKVLSMILKLRVRESPWILESTQDLARKLESIRLPSTKKYWLATGDVTAMYPNIPRHKAHVILHDLVASVADEFSDHAMFVSKLAQWSDNYLVFKHNDKYFYQKEGLAMGIPAAPDVANLYMSYFENTFAERFPLYKRYIDDVFVIIEAPTRKDALAQLDVIQADNLTLTWSLDEKTINFLDLSITQEAGYLSFKPYRKPMNSYERLPFTSYHPLHVKRAAFCGEVSRMARLCSNKNVYYNEVTYVRDIYLKRGYPSALLHNWIRAESNNRWESRYQDAPEATGGNSLWLKSEYNNVWKHIDLHKVWSAMVDGRDISKSPLGHITDVKLSLKRFKNLGEINNRYNADVLAGILVEESEKVLDQGVTPISTLAVRPPQPQLMRLGAWEPQTRINWLPKE
jgi:hypothetical protein